jgi:hypothetical protein
VLLFSLVKAVINYEMSRNSILSCTLDISYCLYLQELFDLLYINSLSIAHCNSLISIHSLDSLKRFSISSCKNLETIHSCQKIESCLVHYCDKLVELEGVRGAFLKSVELVGMSFKDVEPLWNVTTVKLSFCKQLETVTYLTKVKEIHLVACPKVTDTHLLPSTAKVHK